MFLKNRNNISKMKRSKVTDYAALKEELLYGSSHIDEVFFNNRVNRVGSFLLAQQRSNFRFRFIFICYSFQTYYSVFFSCYSLKRKKFIF